MIARRGGNVTLCQLLGLVLAPASRWVSRRILRARIRSLHGLADYFQWQHENGRAGLVDTHKRMALARSELNALEK